MSTNTNDGPTSPLARPWVAIAGAIIGAMTLIFLMALVLVSMTGREVPCSSIFLVCAVLSLGAALATAFIGGNASATGNIPIPGLQEHPLAVSLTGGVAVLLIMLFVTTSLFKRPDCDSPKPTKTVSIERTNDYRESCADGKRFDILRATDTFKPAPAEQFYPVYFRRKKGNVTFFTRRGTEWKLATPVVTPIDNDEAQLELNVPVVEGQAQVQLLQEGAHPIKVGGTGFLTGSHTLIDATVTVILPDGAKLQQGTFDPAEVAKRCGWSGDYTAQCRGVLMTNKPLIVRYTITWPCS